MIYPKRSLGRLMLRGWGFILLMVIGSVALLIAGSLSLRAYHLEGEGIDVVGRVTDMQVTTRSCGKKSRSTCKDYWLGYQFTPVGGAVFSYRTKVEQDFYLKQHLGGALPLRYVAGQPDENEIEPGAARISSWVGLLAGCGLWLVGGLWGGKHVQAARRAVYLRENGVMRRTKVTEKRKTNVKINKQPLYRIIWAAPDGQSWTAWADRLPEVGTEITVFAHPTGAWREVWEGDVGSR